jgi:acetyl-CoA carboxylase carboxyltransferase component
MAVMEGESAVMAVHGAALGQARARGTEPDVAVTAAIAQMREDYEAQLDARYAAARGFVDALIAPEDTRATVAFLLRVVAHNPGPHLGPFVLDSMS